MSNHKHPAAQGNALFTTLLIMFIGLALMLAFTKKSASNVQSTTDCCLQNQTYFSARGAVELIATDIWGRYNNYLISNPTTSFKTWLDNQYSTQWSTFTGVAGDHLLNDSIMTDFRTNAYAGTFKRLLLTSSYQNLRMCDVLVSQVRIYRNDRTANNNLWPGQTFTDLMIVAECQRDLGFGSGSAQVSGLTAASQSTAGGAYSASQYFTFSNPPKFNGLDYAILCKNINCTCCHMAVRNLARVNNGFNGTGKANYGTFPRVKVGCTQSLTIRNSTSTSYNFVGAHTRIDGTVYQRGFLGVEGDGVSNNLWGSVTASNYCSNGMMNTVQFNSNQTSVKQDSTSGYITPATPTNQSANPPNAYGNLYLNYPSSSSAQTDGALPVNSFPAPFPDVNGTRLVDSASLNAVIQGITTTNTLTGGFAVQLPPTSSYTSTSLPSSGSGINLTQTNSGAAYTGTVILNGTANTPIQLNGQVVINGDVMISGYVQGSGQIWATGNVYVPGDLNYKDSTSLLGVVAGKSIIVGDYISQVNAVFSSTTGFYDSPPKQEAGVWNSSYTPSKASNGGYAAPHLSNGNIDVTATTSTSGDSCKNNFANFVAEELAEFNRDEFTYTLPNLPAKPATGHLDVTTSTAYTTTNPNYNASYIPRYYSFYTGTASPPSGASTTKAAQLWMFSGYTSPSSQNGGNGTTYDGTYWNTTLNPARWNPCADGGCTDPCTYGFMTPQAKIPAQVQSSTVQGLITNNSLAVINIHPDWISPDNMQKLIANTEYNRPSTPRELDGLFYTNNAIFLVERQQTLKYNSGAFTTSAAKSSGQVHVKGALICPDMGILVTGNGTTSENDSTPYAFVLDYDSRVQNMLPMNASTNTGYWGITRKGYTCRDGPLPPAP